MAMMNPRLDGKTLEEHMKSNAAIARDVAAKKANDDAIREATDEKQRFDNMSAVETEAHWKQQRDDAEMMLELFPSSPILETLGS